MTQFIENIFSTIFGNNVVFATILISIIPIIELKGAIPFSMSAEIWAESALSLWPAFICGLAGSCLVVPILALIYIPVINWLKKTKLFRNLARKLESRVNAKKENIENKYKDIKIEDNSQKDVESCAVNKSKIIYNKKFFLKAFCVFSFVAIPLPLTGVWTGTCLAIALGLGFWGSCITVILGNVVAGFIITFVSHLFGDSTILFFYILIAIIVIALIATFLVKLINKNKNKADNNL